MRALRVVALCAALVAASAAAWSCDGSKRCNDETLALFRRYPCASDGTITCDKSGTIRLPPLDAQDEQVVACCHCGSIGAPTCRKCDEMGM